MKAPVSALLVLMIACLLTGCVSNGEAVSEGSVTETTRESAPTGNPIEVLVIGDSETTVKTRFGSPTEVKSFTTVRTTTVWTYEPLGFSVSFLDGKLYSIAQWKGGISAGLQVGDPTSKLTELGIEAPSSPAPRDLGVIHHQDWVIRIVGSQEQVEKFVLEPVSDDY